MVTPLNSCCSTDGGRPCRSALLGVLGSNTLTTNTAACRESEIMVKVSVPVAARPLLSRARSRCQPGGTVRRRWA